MRFKCIKSCTLSVWDGSGDEVEVTVGEELPMTYHEYNGCIGLGKNDKELHCSPEEREKYFEKVV